jgi:hypothetical protein
MFYRELTRQYGGPHLSGVDGQVNGEERETFSMSDYTYPHLGALLLLAGLEPNRRIRLVRKNSACGE